MFGLGGLPAVSDEGLYLLRSNAVLLLVSAVGATPLPKMLAQKLNDYSTNAAAALRALGLCMLLLVCTAFLVDGSYNPFLYFRF